MEETTVSIIGIVIASILMFIVPLILISDRSDDIAQLLVQTATAEFVDEVIKTGKITNDKYYKFISELHSSGNLYEIDMEVKILDENTAKIGNSNTYYSIFTTQIENILNSSENGKLILKQGDGISIIVRNESKTFSQTLKSFFSGMKGTNIQIITASATGTIAINGAT